MKILRAFFLSIMALSCSTAFSLDQEVSICALQSESTGDRAFLRICGSRISVNGCDSSLYAVWDMTDHQGAAMYSTALAAFMGDKKVIIRLDEKTCSGLYDVTTMIRIIK